MGVCGFTSCIHEERPVWKRTDIMKKDDRNSPIAGVNYTAGEVPSPSKDQQRSYSTSSSGIELTPTKSSSLDPQLKLETWTKPETVMQKQEARKEFMITPAVTKWTEIGDPEDKQPQTGEISPKEETRLLEGGSCSEVQETHISAQRNFLHRMFIASSKRTPIAPIMNSTQVDEGDCNRTKLSDEEQENDSDRLPTSEGVLQRNVNLVLSTANRNLVSGQISKVRPSPLQVKSLNIYQVKDESTPHSVIVMNDIQEGNLFEGLLRNPINKTCSSSTLSDENVPSPSPEPKKNEKHNITFSCSISSVLEQVNDVSLHSNNQTEDVDSIANLAGNQGSVDVAVQQKKPPGGAGKDFTKSTWVSGFSDVEKPASTRTKSLNMGDLEKLGYVSSPSDQDTEPSNWFNDSNESGVLSTDRKSEEKGSPESGDFIADEGAKFVIERRDSSRALPVRSDNVWDQKEDAKSQISTEKTKPATEKGKIVRLSNDMDEQPLRSITESCSLSLSNFAQEKPKAKSNPWGFLIPDKEPARAKDDLGLLKSAKDPLLSNSSEAKLSPKPDRESPRRGSGRKSNPWALMMDKPQTSSRTLDDLHVWNRERRTPPTSPKVGSSRSASSISPKVIPRSFEDINEHQPSLSSLVPQSRGDASQEQRSSLRSLLTFSSVDSSQVGALWTISEGQSD